MYSYIDIVEILLLPQYHLSPILLKKEVSLSNTGQKQKKISYSSKKVSVSTDDIKLISLHINDSIRKVALKIYSTVICKEECNRMYIIKWCYRLIYIK